MSARYPEPPGGARQLLLLALPPGGFDELVGDLDEEFAERLAAGLGPAEARRWYWSQVARSVPRLVGFRWAEMWRPCSARAHAEGCALLMLVFGLGLGGLQLVSGEGSGAGFFGKGSWGLWLVRLAYPFTLVVATALACRLARLRATSGDALPAMATCGAFAIGLVVLLMQGCSEGPPVGVWLVWTSAALSGAALGANGHSADRPSPR